MLENLEIFEGDSGNFWCYLWGAIRTIIHIGDYATYIGDWIFLNCTFHRKMN